MGTERGEILERAMVDLKGKFIVLIKPDLHISTAEAYAGVNPLLASNSIKKIVENPDLATWKNLLRNNFEDSVFKKYPVIQEIKNKLYQSGANYSSMSGSGSAVYGIFEKPVELTNQFPGMSYWSGIL